MRILCHAKHSKAVLGMEQPESGAGPTAGLGWAWEPAVLCVCAAVDAARSIAAACGDALSVCESCGVVAAVQQMERVRDVVERNVYVVTTRLFSHYPQLRCSTLSTVSLKSLRTPLGG